MTQLQPISLCNVAYKAISKAIVNRLKPLLAGLIPTQFSFVGRQITDNVVIVQETLHTMRRKKGCMGTMIIKLDLDKAYDRLKWSFIRDALVYMQLPSHHVDVIMLCVSYPPMSVLWNGVRTYSILTAPGIQQGDPLSSYLFVLCIERLNHSTTSLRML